jgi:hypothetical protein
VIRSVPIGVLLAAVSCLSMVTLQVGQLSLVRLNTMLHRGFLMLALVSTVCLTVLIIARFVIIH